MKVVLSLLLIVSGSVSFQALAKIDEPDINGDCVKAGIYASAGKVAYQQGEYDKAREVFRDQVAWSEFCHKPQDSIATAYNNIALTYIRQEQYRKAKAWLMLAPDNKKSQYNLSQIKPKLDALPVAASAAGEYWQYAGYGSWNEVDVHAKEAKFRIAFSGMYMGLMSLYYGPNTGEFSVVTTIKEGKALYRQADDKNAGGGQCLVSMDFVAEQVNLHTTGECGFGMNVQAEGPFVRVSP